MTEPIGKKIKKLRLEKGDTLESLSKKINYDYSNLSKVERGVYRPSTELLENISKVYETSPSYFFDGDFTESEGRLLIDENLDPSDLKKKYNFQVDGVEATEEEILEAIKLIRLLKKQSLD